MGQTKLHNYVEDLVWQHLDEEIKLWKDICTCDRCKKDIATYALNNIKPRYYDTQQGFAHTIHDARTGDQLVADVVLGLTAAIRVVAKNPRHEPISGVPVKKDKVD